MFTSGKTVLLLICIFVRVSAKSQEDKLDSNGHRCNPYDVCLPGAEDIAVPPRLIYADNTCGSPIYDSYCPFREGIESCFGCNSSSEEFSHPASLMIDRKNRYSTSNFETWWQSQNSWEWLQQHNTQFLPVNVTVSFNKSYVITGNIKVTFKFTKPAQMVIEKSMDFGESWQPLQFFADDCRRRFKMEPSTLNCSLNQVLCTEKYSDQNEGSVYFSFLNCYTEDSFWESQIQNITQATDIRLKLQYPATDGFEGSQNRINLQGYFYTISDIQVFGRCQCHGHGENCKFPENTEKDGFINIPQCICKHNTEGVNCEKCQSLYNNKAWMPSSSNKKPNKCQKCECYKHASRCFYNSTLDHGVCYNCEHNTEGYFCEKCQSKYYRNLSKSLDDPLVCLECNCSMEGILNDGSCSQENATIGQCLCKKNVTGRRCDKCKDEYYGYSNKPLGNCQACLCNVHGTINGSLNCDDKTGKCLCKDNIDQRTCSRCKLGFYRFPDNISHDCVQCDCDYGGATSEICEKHQGKCLCRYGITNERCSQVSEGRFFPKYDFFLYEAEQQSGLYNISSNITHYNQYFTGRGYASIQADEFIRFHVRVPVRTNFTIAMRYSDATGGINIIIQGNKTLKCPGVERNISVRGLKFGTPGASWVSTNKILLCHDVNYTIFLNSESNTSIKIDSLLLMPDLTQLRSHRMLRSNSSLIDTCQRNSTTITGSLNSLSKCKNVTFSTMIELLNGSLQCECSKTGSKNNTCDEYGGQCSCKQGVMGRSCDKCQPGYYNFTAAGCTPCNCNKLGSENFVCHPTTGQCLCKLHVEGRACDHCRQHYYGLHTGLGCSPCDCDNTGSVNLTCDDTTGKCHCKPGVESIETDKCERCQENYFNFTKDGCQACNCSIAGSRSLQCHNMSGECACKLHTTGKKCSTCVNGTFSLEKFNPTGCLPCFCFNRSKLCSSADGYVLKQITKSNLTIPLNGKVEIPRKFKGFHLNSYVRIFQVNFTQIVNVSGVELKLLGVRNNATLKLGTEDCLSMEQNNYCVILHEENSNERLTANQMQSVLSDIKHAFLTINGLKNATSVGVSMGTAIQGRHGKVAGHVEKCLCPTPYEDMSCQNCREGYTRDVPNSNAFVDCVTCSCNNRSRECDGESGVCKGCRLSLGDHCEICGFGVDISTGCSQCLPTYWHPDIANEEKACRTCSCVLNNTIYHNSSICNATTGQCSCKSYVGGLRCERCAENYYNTSHGCRECPICYGLMKNFLHNLRALIIKVDKTAEHLERRFDAIKNNEFAVRLSNATLTVNEIFSKTNITNGVELTRLNVTSDMLNDLTSEVRIIQEQVEMFKTSKEKLSLYINMTISWVKDGYRSLENANTSRKRIIKIKDNITSYVYDLQKARDMMGDLVEIISTLSKNLTKVSQLNDIFLELSRAKTFEIINFKNNTENISSLKSISEATLRYGRIVLNTSRNFFNKTEKALTKSIDILATVMDLLKSTEMNRNLNKMLNTSIRKIELDFEAIIENTTISLQDSKSTRHEAELSLNKSISLLKQANTLKENVTRANHSAATTLQKALDTLEVLQNFQNISQNAVVMASNSLRQINKVKKESNKSIHEITTVSKLVKEGLKYTQDGIKFAEEAKTLSSQEHQNTTSIYNNSKTLQENHQKSFCSRHSNNSHINISTRARVLETLFRTCLRREARDANVNANERWVRSAGKQVVTNKINDDVMRVKEKMKDQNEELQKINKKVLDGRHQTQIDNHSTLFQQLRNELNKLTQTKERRTLMLNEMKQRIGKIKKEIADLTSLRRSLQDINICS